MNYLLFQFAEHITLLVMIVARIYGVKEPLGIRQKSSIILTSFIHLQLVLVSLACTRVPLRHVRTELLIFVE